MRASEVCDPGESEWEAKARKNQGRHIAVTSQNGWLKAWKSRGIALDGKDSCDVRHGRLIITPDGNAKEK